MRRLSLTSTAWLPLLALKLIVLRARGIYCSVVQFWYRGRCPLQLTHNRPFGLRPARRLRPYLYPHFIFAALLPASPQFGQARERTTPSPPSRAAPPMSQSTNKPINHSTNPPGSSGGGGGMGSGGRRGWNQTGGHNLWRANLACVVGWHCAATRMRYLSSRGPRRPPLCPMD